MKRLYLVFNIVKLTTTPTNSILDQHTAPLLNIVMVDNKKKQKVE